MTRARRSLVSPRSSYATGGGADYTNWGLAALSGLLATGCVMWVGAALAAISAGRGLPDGGLLPALAALTDVGDPSRAWPHPEQLPGWIPYWGCTLFVWVALGGCAILALRLRRRFSVIGLVGGGTSSVTTRAGDPRGGRARRGTQSPASSRGRRTAIPRGQGDADRGRLSTWPGSWT